MKVVLRLLKGDFPTKLLRKRIVFEPLQDGLQGERRGDEVERPREKRILRGIGRRRGTQTTREGWGDVSKKTQCVRSHVRRGAPH